MPAGEGRDRDAVELALVVGDLAGLVELHQPGGEHLGVDAVVAAVALGEQPGDRRRDRADPGLQRVAVGDEGAGVLGDRALGVAGRRVGDRERRRVGLDEDVDLVDVERVAVARAAGRGAREARARPRRSAGGRGPRPRASISAAVPPACSERLHQPSASGGAAAVAITRGACSSSSGAKRRKSAGSEADVRAGVAQDALDRAEEAREVVDVGVVEELGADQEQGAVDAQVLPVVALAERLQQRRRLARARAGCRACRSRSTRAAASSTLSLSRHRPGPYGFGCFFGFGACAWAPSAASAASGSRRCSASRRTGSASPASSAGT